MLTLNVKTCIFHIYCDIYIDVQCLILILSNNCNQIYIGDLKIIMIYAQYFLRI